MIVIAAIVFALDRLAKMWAYDKLRLMKGGTQPLWDNVIHLTYARNEGVSFGFLSGKRELLLIVTGIICLALLVVMILFRKKPIGVRALGWMLIGGALGNLYDRVRFGFVIDMIEIRLFRFAIFNVADMALCVSIALIALVFLFGAPREVKRS